MTEQDTSWIRHLVEPLRVKPGAKVNLARDYHPGARFGVRKKRDGVALLERGVDMLAEYQDRLAAQDTWGVLVVLQALDAAGKDGTIRHVMSGVNPQGVKVASFKAPSAEELEHDYLWRHAQHLPARGEIGIFNRSHYEEVLVVRVHPEFLDRSGCRRHKGKIWARRYREINDWEHYLVDNGIRVVKLFLNLSREEQRAGSSSGSTSRRRTGSSPPATCASAATGTNTRRPTPRCSATPAPSGRPGTSCPPTASGSPGSARPRSSPRP